MNLEHAAGPRPQREGFDVAIKRGKELLRHPRGTQHPAALGAVVNFYLVFVGHGAGSMRISARAPCILAFIAGFAASTVVVGRRRRPGPPGASRTCLSIESVVPR